MKFKSLSLLGMFAVCLQAQSVQSLLISSNSAAVTVDKSQSEVTFPAVFNLMTNDPYVVYEIMVPMYTNSVKVVPYGGLVFQGAPKPLDVTIKTAEFQPGTYLIPITLHYYNYYTAVSIQLTVTGQTLPQVTPAKAYFPHWAAGEGWTSTILFTNTTNTAQNITIKFFDVYGAVKEVRSGISPITATYGSEQTLTLPANGSTYFVIYDAGQSLTTGTAEVVVSTGGKVNATLVFGRDGKESSIPTFSQIENKLTFPLDTANGYDLGIAFMNMSTIIQVFTVSTYNQSGVLVDRRLVALQPRAQQAMTMSQLSPFVRNIRGTVQVTCDNPALLGFALRFTPLGNFTTVLN